MATERVALLCVWMDRFAWAQLEGMGPCAIL